jgi:cyclopropane-fatty-acyl-phospholipid synthase
MSVAIELAERGLIPDALLRAGIRRELRARLREERERAGDDPAAAEARFAALLAASPIALAADKANEQHYEVPPQFFGLVLGPRRKYSCAFFGGEESLAEAEELMLALTCARAEVADGMRLLDLGCGWGALTLFLAERFLARAHRGGLELGRRSASTSSRSASAAVSIASRSSPPTSRASSLRAASTACSVEMFEHVRNWPALFARIARWLEPGGKLFMHVFCHRAFAYSLRGPRRRRPDGAALLQRRMMPSVGWCGASPTRSRSRPSGTFPARTTRAPRRRGWRTSTASTTRRGASWAASARCSAGGSSSSPSPSCLRTRAARRGRGALPPGTGGARSVKIAIVGAGVSGLVCARLLQRDHDVRVFEASDRLGGHACTERVRVGGRDVDVDTGFVVYNERTYPLFTRLLAELGVATQPTEMSFSVSCERSGLEYNGGSLRGLFADPRNLVRPRFLGMLRDALRFYREAESLLASADAKTSLGDWLEGRGYGEAFVEQHSADGRGDLVGRARRDPRLSRERVRALFREPRFQRCATAAVARRAAARRAMWSARSHCEARAARAGSGRGGV